MTTHQAICEEQEYQPLFREIDRMRARIDQFKLEPQFHDEIRARSERRPNYGLSDEQLLRSLIELIAYSQRANAKAVKRLIDRGDLDIVFQGYDLQVVENLNKDEILQEYWPEKGKPRKPVEIGAIQIKKKIDSMIGCAPALIKLQNDAASFMDYLRGMKIPDEIETESDLNSFWTKFDQVKDKLKTIGMPFFASDVSLCHLFTHLGYDSAKPDSGVMKAAVELSIVTKSGSKERRETIKRMQLYGMCQHLRAPVVDFYFLIQGGQSWAQQFVSKDFYNQQA